MRKTLPRMGVLRVESLETRALPATVTFADGILLYQADPGEVNHVQICQLISPAGDYSIYITDGGTTVVGAPGLTATAMIAINYDENQGFVGQDGGVILPNNPEIEFIKANLGDMDDFIENCTDKQSTMDGEAGNDTLHGGSNDDVIIGGDDNDVIHGNGGIDDLRGGFGEDWLSGGDGWDILAGGPDADTLYGGDGRDDMDGGGGNDKLFGEGDNDDMKGGVGDDTLDGGAGADAMDGGEMNDWLYGGAGNDSMRGGPGSDYLDGDEGDDDYWGDDGNGPLDIFPDRFTIFGDDLIHDFQDLVDTIGPIA